MARFFISRPIVAIVIAIITVVGGFLSMRTLPVSQFPAIIPPQIIVSTSYAGADAVTVEQSIATPLEQQLNGVDDMMYIQSNNANDGTMSLTVTFDVETDPSIDQVNVQNRVAQAQPNLPADVNQYGLSFRKSTGTPMMLVSLYSPGGSTTRCSWPTTPTSTSSTRSTACAESARSACSAPATTRCASGSSRTCWPGSASPSRTWCARCRSRTRSTRQAASAPRRRRRASR